MNLPTPNHYDAENAARLCQASAQTYERSLAATCEPLNICSPKTDTLVQITRESDFDTIVAFRGTQDLRNWLTDADIAFHKMDAGAVEAVRYERLHAGFFNAILSVFEPIEDALRKQAGPRLWVTGHSLGGALAMLFTHFTTHALSGCYTFGQPRCGDAAFVKHYDFWHLKHTFRVVHHLDIVPHLPFLLGQYRHAGMEAWYRQDDPECLLLDRPAWDYALTDITAILETWLMPKSQIEQWIADHSLNNYLALFSQARNNPRLDGAGAGNGTVIPPRASPAAFSAPSAPSAPLRETPKKNHNPVQP